MIEYQIVRSDRKSLAIHITKKAGVEVRVPFFMPDSEIRAFVVSHQDWIEKNLSQRIKVNKEKQAFALCYGDSVMLLGKMYPIKAGSGRAAGFDQECLRIPENLAVDEIKSLVISLYKEIAKRFLHKKVRAFSQSMRVAPKSVRITSAKTRWGSCSSNNGLNFSWRLIMAGEDMVNYVVVHELAHIKEHNHSPRFWAVVESVLPDYKNIEAKFKPFQEMLSVQDWD